MERYYKIKDNETLELFIVSSDEQPENSVLVTDENSNFIKPKANDVKFTKVVETATDEEIKALETPIEEINLVERIESLQTEIDNLKSLLTDKQ